MIGTVQVTGVRCRSGNTNKFVRHNPLSWHNMFISHLGSQATRSSRLLRLKNPDQLLVVLTKPNNLHTLSSGSHQDAHRPRQLKSQAHENTRDITPDAEGVTVRSHRASLKFSRELEVAGLARGVG